MPSGADSGTAHAHQRSRRAQHEPPHANGLLPVFKLPGPTSHDVVAATRRWLGQRRVGHGGTLDPAAAGVLPLLLGSATRLARYVTLGDKEYRFVLSFGAETDTGDQQGRVVRSAPVPSRAAVEAALPAFRGLVRQQPPAWSAVKVRGRAAHRRARAGEDVQPPTRTVRIASLECVAWHGGSATFHAVCSHGTYIRALAADLARAADSAGHCAALLRTRVGPISLDDCRTVEELQAWLPDGTGHAPPGCAPTAAVRQAVPWRPPQAVLAQHPQVEVDAPAAGAVAAGAFPPGVLALLGPPRVEGGTGTSSGVDGTHEIGSGQAETSDTAVIFKDRLLAVAGVRGGRWSWITVFPEAMQEGGG